METTTNKPIDKIRFGAVTATIWQNDGEKGPWYNVTLSRVYRDKNDKPKDSSSLSGTASPSNRSRRDLTNDVSWNYLLMDRPGG